MNAYLLVALGSAVGGVARFGLGGWAAERLGAAWLGTLCVNVTGSALIGLLAALQPGSTSRDLLMVGVLGGYTTFSSFSLQTLELLQQGRFGTASLYIAGSVAGSLLSVSMGYAVGSLFRG